MVDAVNYEFPTGYVIELARNGGKVAFRLKVGTFNFRRGGWKNSAQLDTSPLVDTISAFAPHVLFLQECRRWRDDGNAILFQVAEQLSELLPDDDQYVPYLGSRGSDRYPTATFVSQKHVRVKRWYEPRNGQMHEWQHNFLKTNIAGHEVWLSSIHWHGGHGDAEFEKHAAMLARMGGYSTIVGGDFNCTASGPREVDRDWRLIAERESYKLIQKMNYNHEKRVWEPRTWPLDMLIGSWNEGEGRRESWAGFYDLGEQGELNASGEPVAVLTPTVNTKVDAGGSVRIDRLLASQRFPGTLVPGSYRVHIPETGHEASDHRYVTASFDLAPV